MISPSFSFFFLINPPPPRSTLFPYTTLFRSRKGRHPALFRGKRRSQVSIRRHQDQLRLLGQTPILICLARDRKSTRLNSSHITISYAVFCLKKKKIK